MKTLDIVFTRSKKKIPIGSWAIRWWVSLLLKGRKGLFKLHPTSHCAVQQEIREWGKRYFQASEGRVNYEFEDFFNQKHKIIKTYTLEVSTDIDRYIKHQCYVEAGNSYSTLQNLGMFISGLLSFFGIRSKPLWKEGRNCSELIYRCVIMSMFGDLGFNSDNIYPHQIELIIQDKFRKGEDGIWRRE